MAAFGASRPCRAFRRRSLHETHNGRSALDEGTSLDGRVGVWRGGGRPNISVAAPFVWRCLTGSTLAPFPHPAHRTGHADLPHPALGQDVTPSPTTGPDQAVRGVRAGGARKGARGITPALTSPDLVLELEPPAQPHSRVVVERAIGFEGGADTE